MLLPNDCTFSFFFFFPKTLQLIGLDRADSETGEAFDRKE